MTILIWNCRGLGSTLTIKTLQKLINKHKPSLVFLSETKHVQNYVDKWRRLWGFAGSFYVNPFGKSGGLALWWTTDTDIQVLDSSVNFIDIVVHEETDWHFTGIYGSPTPDLRLQVWQSISRLNLNNNTPWLVIGDFNCCSNFGDKVGGRNVNWRHMMEFNSFMEGNDLYDVDFKGEIFTWSNMRAGDENIRARLDKGIANSEWNFMFPRAIVIHEAFLASDHRPIVVQFESKKVFKKLFKFQSRWANFKECKSLIEQVWVDHGINKKISSFMHHCRKVLTKWNKDFVGNTQTQISTVCKELDDIKGTILSEESKAREVFLLRKLEELQTNEEEFWKQKSRVSWLNSGDKNTRFFHLSTVLRRKRNAITLLRDAHNQVITDPSLIEKEITSFYSYLYSKKGVNVPPNVINAIPVLITSDMNNDLLKEITEVEIHAAVFGLGPTKAPGPDGFSGIYFQKYWSVMSVAVIQMVKEFFASGTLPDNLNNTHIALIPKTKNPQKISDYRPISCTNFLYKVITKILSNRLKPLLEILISPEQGAFVGERNIQDSIIIAHEMLHTLKHKKCGNKGYMALKLDMLKAFDRLDWNFIQVILSKMGFHQHWITCVMNCITTVKYSILINGKPAKYFSPKGGLRQGDPMSPYIFILATEVLSRMLKQGVQENSISSIQVNPHCPTVSHVLYADDTLILGQASYIEANNLRAILSNFGLASGQQINEQKSEIIFSPNVSLKMRKKITSSFNIQESNDLGQYLGVPATWGRTKTQVFSILIDKLKNKLQSWKGKLLSQAGKEVLLKAVAQALPTYMMSVFMIPKHILLKMEQLIRNFWWNNDWDLKKLHLISWEKLTKSKEDGGLGFRELESFNIALLGKVSWKLIHQPDSLLAKVLKAAGKLPIGSQVQTAQHSANWHPPPQNCLKFNTDASFHKTTNLAVLGGICRTIKVR